MPRKAFIADLQSAASDLKIDHLSSVKAGDEDGTITFKFHSKPSSYLSDPGIRISAIVPDVSDYPSSHQYILCTDSENVPDAINAAMQDIGEFPGFNIHQMLTKVAKTLGKATAGSKLNPVDLDDPMDIDDSDQGSDDEEEDEEDEDNDFSDDDWATGVPKRPRQVQTQNSSRQPRDRSAMLALNKRIRCDLRAAKDAGFRVGHLGQLLNNGEDSFVTISCRVSKFGISAEALQAWQLDPRLYFTMVMRYTAGYCSLARLMREETAPGACGMKIRVGLTQRYKITLAEAIDAFTEKVDKSREPTTSAEEFEAAGRGLAPFFISRPVNDLLEQRLVVLLKYRSKYAFKWNGAEDYYEDNLGMSSTVSDDLNSKYWQPEVPRNTSLPTKITNDHFGEIQESSYSPDEVASFPLTAMQFALRHLVRCTEFCLVCHCRVETDFEALKPYVCSKGLCLYQYMAFGFGPSIEHEIVSQPHVVDLLVSFCYSSASTSNALKVFPDGMGLTVPSPKSITGYTPAPSRYGYGYPPDILQNPQPAPSHRFEGSDAIYKARYDAAKNELVFATGDMSRPLRTANWVCLTIPGSIEAGVVHCRVMAAMYPTVRLGPAVNPRPKEMEEPQPNKVKKQITSRAPVITPAATPPLGMSETTTTKLPEISFTVYEQNFDELSAAAKSKSIQVLLDTLPSITRMKEYLESGRHTSLSSWIDRISPAALGVLRWIIASNRSCIIQVDNLGGASTTSEERVSGMPEYMQFRFAQGAPDKEQRFIQSVRDNIDAKKSNYPTLFAWHGSSLHNWHSIVREGLHFREIVNGRACGHGVYFSPHAQTSLGYSGMNRYGSAQTFSLSNHPGVWPQSQLRITDALSLNEIVNRPDKFVNTNPHLVVDQLDWIQTRYLLVRCNIPGDEGPPPDVPPTEVYAQDPTYTAKGLSNHSISIPITAVSKSRRHQSAKTAKNGNKKARLSGDDEVTYISDDTDVEDLEIFFPDKEEEPASTNANELALKGKSKAPTKPEHPKTDFIPGSLDHSTLPILEPPSYATTTATKTLQKELQATLRIQDATPAHELGWYLDSSLITNVYQWIIELHSFEPHLPLAKDLKARKLHSVVLELRFGASYPMSPPFVRVIRPRFLSFMAGGGGHVTAGGALCMELLTNSGWSVASNIESVLVQVRAAISSTDPKPARLEQGPVRDYGTGEAIEAYVRACQTHGWEVPRDFRSNYSDGGARSF